MSNGQTTGHEQRADGGTSNGQTGARAGHRRGTSTSSDAKSKSIKANKYSREGATGQANTGATRWSLVKRRKRGQEQRSSQFSELCGKVVKSHSGSVSAKTPTYMWTFDICLLTHTHDEKHGCMVDGGIYHVYWYASVSYWHVVEGKPPGESQRRATANVTL